MEKTGVKTQYAKSASFAYKSGGGRIVGGARQFPVRAPFFSSSSINPQKTNDLSDRSDLSDQSDRTNQTDRTDRLKKLFPLLLWDHYASLCDSLLESFW